MKISSRFDEEWIEHDESVVDLPWYWTFFVQSSGAVHVAWVMADGLVVVL